MARKTEPVSTLDLLMDGFQQMKKKATGLTRGGIRDPLATQRFVPRRQLSLDEVEALYEGNWLAGNVVDAIAEDIVQSGWRFRTEDRNLSETIENDWANLSLKGALFDMVKYGLIDGDGYVGIGLKQGGTVDLSQEVGATVKGIEYLHPFRRRSVKAQTRNMNPLSPEYGNWLSYEIYTQPGHPEQVVHGDRILHYQPHPAARGAWGNSVYQRIYDVIQVTDNAVWSFGQIVYQMVFKVMKVKFSDTRAKMKEKGMDLSDMSAALADDLNALTLWIMDRGDKDGPGDSLEFPGLSGSLGALPAIKDFLVMLMAASTRIPQSRLVGNEQGKLSGAEWDAQTYFTRIRGLQESRLQPLIEKVTDYLLVARGYNPLNVEYEIEFEPLYVESDKSRAETDRIVAETDAIYMDRNVRTPDEVREEREFGEPLLGELEAEEPEESEVPIAGEEEEVE